MLMAGEAARPLGLECLSGVGPGRAEGGGALERGAGGGEEGAPNAVGRVEPACGMGGGAAGRRGGRDG